MNKSVLKKLFSLLEKYIASYVLIGGYAVAAWGSIRATKDMDFLIKIAPDHIDRLISGLKSVGFTVDYRTGDFNDPVRGLIKLTYPVGDDTESIELLLGIKKMPSQIYSRAIIIRPMGLAMPVISPEDLIVLKLLANGPLDINDAKNVYQIGKDKLDIQYLQRELGRCGLSLDLIT